MDAVPQSARPWLRSDLVAAPRARLPTSLGNCFPRARSVGYRVHVAPAGVGTKDSWDAVTEASGQLSGVRRWGHPLCLHPRGTWSGAQGRVLISVSRVTISHAGRRDMGQADPQPSESASLSLLGPRPVPASCSGHRGIERELTGPGIAEFPPFEPQVQSWCGHLRPDFPIKAPPKSSPLCAQQVPRDTTGSAPAEGEAAPRWSGGDSRTEPRGAAPGEGTTPV